MLKSTCWVGMTASIWVESWFPSNERQINHDYISMLWATFSTNHFSPKKTQISVICTNFRVTFNSVSSNVIYESHSPFQWNLNKPARRHYTGLLKVTCFSCDFSLTEWTYFGVLYSTFVRVISAMNHVSDRVEHSRFKEQWRYHIMEWSL